MRLASLAVLAIASSAAAKPRLGGDLSRVGRGDFSIRFTLVTQSRVASAVVSQRRDCAHGVFWDVRMSAEGALGVETDGGGAYTVLVANGAVNDGKPHAIAITRSKGRLWIDVDGKRRARGESASALGDLAPLAVGRDVCESVDGTHALDGKVTGLAIR